jgi:hypothetical protein
MAYQFVLGWDPDSALLFRNLCREVATETFEWKAIALELHITDDDVDSIDKYYGRDNQECFRRVFSKWRRAAHRPFSWSTMIEVLNDVGEHYLAEQLREKHCPSE